MGWLRDKVLQGKNLFEKKPQKEFLQLQDLQPWLQGQLQRAIAEHKLEEAVAAFIQQVGAKRWQLELKLEEWKSLLRDKEGKEAQRKKSELENFFTEVQAIIHVLHFPEQPLLEEVCTRHQELGKILQESKEFLDKYSEEGHTVLLPDGREAEQVIFTPFIKELLELENFQKEFDQKMAQSRIKTLEVLQEKRQQLESATQTLARLQGKITAVQQRVQAAEEKQVEKAKELEQWKLHPAFSMFQRLEENRKLLKQRIVAHQDEVVRFFSPLVPVLEALKIHLLNPRLADQYIQDSENAFFHDEQLGIIVVLQEIKAFGLEKISATLSVTLQQTTAFFEKLVQAESGHLQQLHKQQQELQQQGASIAPSPEERETIVKMEDAQYRLEHFIQQVAQLRHQLKEVQEQYAELLEQRTQEVGLFQHLAKMGFGVEVEVKV